jgi:hypothetical protein
VTAAPASWLIEYGGRSVAIDTHLFREQAIRENIRSLTRCCFAPTRADHILGIDDADSFRRIASSLCPSMWCAFWQHVSLHLDADYKFGGLPQGTNPWRAAELFAHASDRSP